MWDSRKFCEWAFGSSFLCPVGKARQGKAGREIPATVQRVQGEEPPIGGVEQNTTRTESESGGQHPRTRYGDRLTGENAREVCPPLDERRLKPTHTGGPPG